MKVSIRKSQPEISVRFRGHDAVLSFLPHRVRLYSQQMGRRLTRKGNKATIHPPKTVMLVSVGFKTIYSQIWHLSLAFLSWFRSETLMWGVHSPYWEERSILISKTKGHWHLLCCPQFTALISYPLSYHTSPGLPRFFIKPIINTQV